MVGTSFQVLAPLIVEPAITNAQTDLMTENKELSFPVTISRNRQYTNDIIGTILQMIKTIIHSYATIFVPHNDRFSIELRPSTQHRENNKTSTEVSNKQKTP